jgi:hypothetical protein
MREGASTKFVHGLAICSVARLLKPIETIEERPADRVTSFSRADHAGDRAAWRISAVIDVATGFEKVL